MANRRFRMKRGVNITRVVAKIATTILVLYVGGVVVNEVGNVLLYKASPFYKGFALLGWTFTETVNGTSADLCYPGGTNNITGVTEANCITGVGGAGILAVVGIIGIASIVMEFVEFRL